jgi:DeoR/GlpR family transcriptional regulator of sugar metabolism
LGAIRQMLATEGKVISSDLALKFDVTEDTIRRDLRDLAKAGHCQRVYGGALAQVPGQAPDFGPISARAAEDKDGKTRMARRVVELLADARTLFIDGGSTNIAIARLLPRDRKLTVITNTPAVALALEDHPLATVILTGGVFDREKGVCLGPQALRDIQLMLADTFVLGTCGADPLMGLTALDPMEPDLKRAMAAQRARILAAVSTSKLGTVAPFKVAAPSPSIHLVLDRDASPKKTDAFLQAEFIVDVCP